MPKKNLLDESVDLNVNLILDSLGLTIPNERRKYRAVKARLRAIIHVIRASVLQLDRRHEKVLDHARPKPASAARRRIATPRARSSKRQAS